MSEINYEEVTDPMMLDSTGLAIVNKLEAIKNAVQPTNASTDIEISIPTDAWIADLPDYVCTWSNSHVTSGCSVEVEFLEGAENAEGLYLYFEKVTGGIRFTSPILPTVAIPLKVHILAADAESVAATSADQVSTSAVPNKANVEEALSSHQSSLTSLTNQIANINTEIGVTYSAMKSGSIISLSVFKLGGYVFIKADYVSPSSNISAGEWITIGNVPDFAKPNGVRYCGAVFIDANGNVKSGFRGSVDTSGSLQGRFSSALSTSDSLFMSGIIYDI